VADYIAVDELRYEQLLQECYRFEAELKESIAALERTDALVVKTSTGENVVESLSGTIGLMRGLMRRMPSCQVGLMR
jgi:hypothetical protein